LFLDVQAIFNNLEAVIITGDKPANLDLCLALLRARAKPDATQDLF
jgi:hypothetical protein